MSPESCAPFIRTMTYVTVEVGGQTFGLPIARVSDVFALPCPTPVPLAPPEVLGLVNLRGRVVTAIDLRRRFGLPLAADRSGRMAVGIDKGGESYGFVVDAVGEVVTLGADTFDPTPAHLDGAWARLACGLHRLDGRLLVIMNVDAVLDPDPTALAA